MDTFERYAKLISALNGDERGIKSYIKDYNSKRNLDFVSFIDEYIYSHGIQRSYIIREANLNPQYGYKLLNGSKHTHNRNIILRICIAMGMNLEDTQQSLRCYDMRLLDIEIIRDKIIMAGIETRKKLLDIDIWLCKAGESSLFNDCT